MSRLISVYKSLIIGLGKEPKGDAWQWNDSENIQWNDSTNVELN